MNSRVLVVRDNPCGLRRGLGVADRSSVILLTPGKEFRARIKNSVDTKINGHEKCPSTEYGLWVRKHGVF